MNLTFNEEAHEYKLGDRVLPSVTTILKEVGIIDSSHFNEYAMKRGSDVHKACEQFDMGELDEEKLDPALVGYVSAYKKFRAEFTVEWTEIEKPRHDASLGFAGTPDRVGGDTVIDIKTGTKQPWHGYQLAAYSMLACNMPTVATRFGLYLSSEGTYRLIQYKDRSDFDTFRAAVIVFNAKGGANGSH